MDNTGALVGWSHHDSGDRILLRLESAQSSAALAAKELDLSRVLMTKQQALVLGHYLMRLSGETIQPARRSWVPQVLRRRGLSDTR
jgi:hypothetical protein